MRGPGRSILSRALGAHPRFVVLPGLSYRTQIRMSSTISDAIDDESNPLVNELNRLRKPVELSEKYVDMTGAVIFREVMKEHGVEKVFGYPGARPATVRLAATKWLRKGATQGRKP